MQFTRIWNPQCRTDNAPTNANTFFGLGFEALTVKTLEVLRPLKRLIGAWTRNTHIRFNPPPHTAAEQSPVEPKLSLARHASCPSNELTFLLAGTRTSNPLCFAHATTCGGCSVEQVRAAAAARRKCSPREINSNLELAVVGVSPEVVASLLDFAYKGVVRVQQKHLLVRHRARSHSCLESAHPSPFRFLVEASESTGSGYEP